MRPTSRQRDIPDLVESDAVDVGAKRLNITPTYYVFRHLSQFVDVGAKRIGSSGGFNDALVFKNPDNSIVAVMYNSMSSARTVTVQVRSGRSRASASRRAAGRRSTRRRRGRGSTSATLQDRGGARSLALPDERLPVGIRPRPATLTLLFTGRVRGFRLWFAQTGSTPALTLLFTFRVCGLRL